MKGGLFLNFWYIQNNATKTTNAVTPRHDFHMGSYGFFLLISYGRDYVVVSRQTITRCCILMEIEKNIYEIRKELEFIISPCHNLIENDTK